MKLCNAWPLSTQLTISLSLLLLLSACSNFAPLKNPNWQAEGKLAIIESRKKTAQVQYIWQQQQQTYRIHALNVLGQVLFTLQGDQAQAFYQDAKGREFKSQNPELLLLELTGWSFPISLSQYWLQGKLSGQEQQLQFDSNKRPTSFMVHNWQVKLRFHEQQTNPSRITLTQPNSKIILLVKNYERFWNLFSTSQN